MASQHPVERRDAGPAGAADGLPAAAARAPTDGRTFFHRVEKEHPRPAPGLVAGKAIGDFRLVSLLGQGGMGQVWEAEQLSLARTVAVKFVRPESLGENARELFAREARAAARLAHPGIVTVYGHGETDGLAWIAMELVTGAWTLEDFLDEVVRTDELPAGYDRHVARFVAEIAEAMQAAHAAGVIHRDLKPQNVLITPDDRPKVSDFGLARVAGEAALSHTGDFAGTFFYMSPEQVAARRAGLDHRTDVFSLGAVLYECLALRRPFEGDTGQQVAAQILAKDPPALHSIRSHVPHDLVVIAGKALEKDRDRRYQTMQAFADDLRRFLAHEPIHARPPTRLDRASKWVQRHPAISSVAAIVAVTFTAIALLLFANVRANRALRLEQEKLALKSVESEERRIAAESSAERAHENELRADREAEAARQNAELAGQRLDEVLSLSALQELDELVAGAYRLWPAHPANREAYRAWLARAADLTQDLPAYEARLAELRARALPLAPEEEAAQRAAHPRFPELALVESELAYLRARREALEAGPRPDPDAARIGLDLSDLPDDVRGLNDLAWVLVDPKRTEFGEEEKGLLIARRALEVTDERMRPDVESTLAWALFSVGRIDEALEQVDRALAGAVPALRPAFQRDWNALHAAVDEAFTPETVRAEAERIARLESEREALERELATRTRWTFESPRDRWWHDQLEELERGIRELTDETDGLASNGISPLHGWGVAKRLAHAEELAAGFAPGGAFAGAWEAALPALRAAYPGLALDVQIGLVPLGPDPDSKLWEFADLGSGEPAVRGADGKLEFREESGLVLVLLRGGTFTMGSQRKDAGAPNYDAATISGEEPPHVVTLSPFFLSKYEMTQAQWMRLTGRNPSSYQPPSQLVATLLHPVEQVSWFASREVCARIGLELPTEAQWEYAARGGTQTVWWTGDDPASLKGAGNLVDRESRSAGDGARNPDQRPDLDDGFAAHAPVDRFAANPFGFHGTIGNVCEWCLDGFQPLFYRLSPRRDPLGDPTSSSTRIVRGGGFGSGPPTARSASRQEASPGDTDESNGLRPARVLVAR
jgi:serine/threonine protein kinase/formylglycine-generating enzyme required for sulfatase activity